MKPIALQLYTLRDAAAQDFAGVLKTVADIGYVGVEFAGLYGLTPTEAKKIVDDLGLRVASGHMALPTPENAQQLIDECGILGIDTLVAGFGPDQFKTLDLVKESAAKFQLAAELLKPAGLGFAFHNHWWEFETLDGETVEDIILAEAPDANAEIDLYWAEVGGGDAAGALTRLGDRAPLLHVKDGLVEPKSPMTAVGKGVLDYKSILVGTNLDVTKWLIVEIDACATDMTEAVRDSYTYLVGNGLATGTK